MIFFSLINLHKKITPYTGTVFRRQKEKFRKAINMNFVPNMMKKYEKKKISYRRRHK